MSALHDLQQWTGNLVETQQNNIVLGKTSGIQIIGHPFEKSKEEEMATVL